MPVSSRCPTPERADASSLAAGFTDDARFSAWLQRTRESERAALARELHDELGAILTAARLDVAWLAAQPACHAPQIAERLANGESAVWVFLESGDAEGEFSLY